MNAGNMNAGNTMPSDWLLISLMRLSQHLSTCLCTVATKADSSER